MVWVHLRHGILLALAAAACGKGGGKKGPDRDLPENQAIMAKIDGYRDCLTDHAARVFRIADLYRQRFRDAAPTPTSAIVLPASDDPKKCLSAIDKARTLTPAMPDVDAAGAAFGKALRTVHEVTTAAHGHFEVGSATYDPAKGAQLHPALLAAFDAFDTAQAGLFDHVLRLNRTVHLSQFAARVAKEGRSLETLTEAAMLEAEDLVRFAALPWDQLDKLDLAAMDLRLAAYERKVEELVAFAIDHPKETELFDRFNGFTEYASQLEMAARQLARRARDKLAYTDAEKLMIASGNEAGVIGTPAALAEAYNRLQLH